MSLYVAGNIVTVSTTVKDKTGALVDPGSIQLLVQNPDGSLTTFSSPVHDSLGAFHQDVTPATAGRYVYRWVTTGAVGASEGEFDVVAAFASAGIVGLADVKAHLTILDSSRDGELLGFIEAATPVIESIVGPVTSRTRTEWHTADGDMILLRYRPVISIASVTEYAGQAIQALTEQSPDSGQALDAFGYFVDYEVGSIQRTAYGTPSWFGVVPWVWSGQQPALYVAPRLTQLSTGRVKVVYTAGRAAVPANVRLATLELIRHNWQMTRGGRVVATGAGFDDNAEPAPTGFAVPNRVIELLLPDGQTGRIA